MRAEVDPRGRTAVYSVVDQGYLQHSRVRDLETGQETTLPFALYEHRFSRDGHWIAGESREGELVVCAISTGRCRPLTPKDDDGVAGLAWSADGTPSVLSAADERASVRRAHVRQCRGRRSEDARTDWSLPAAVFRCPWTSRRATRLSSRLAAKAHTSYGWRSCASAGTTAAGWMDWREPTAPRAGAAAAFSRFSIACGFRSATPPRAPLWRKQPRSSRQNARLDMSRQRTLGQDLHRIDRFRERQSGQFAHVIGGSSSSVRAPPH